MADLLKFEMRPSGLAIEMTTNDLIYNPAIDYRDVSIADGKIIKIVKEENSEDGLNVSIADGDRYTVFPHLVTKVGNITGTIPVNLGLPNDPYMVFADNDALQDALFTLLGW